MGKIYTIKANKEIFEVKTVAIYHGAKHDKCIMPFIIIMTCLGGENDLSETYFFYFS